MKAAKIQRIENACLWICVSGVSLFASLQINATDALIADAGFAFPAVAQCESDLRYLNQVGGWQAAWPQQWQAIASADVADIERSIAHWSQVPRSLSRLKQQLQSSITRNEVAPRPVVLRVHQQVQDVALRLDTGHSPYLFENTESHGASQWNALINDTIAPAFRDFERFLRTEYLLQANSDTGLAATKDGQKCFVDATVWWTSLNLPPDQISHMGKRLLKENRQALALTGEGGESVDDALKRLRTAATNDSTSADDLITISELALKRAHEKTLLAFSYQASEPITVAPLPLYMQAAFPAGRYVASDGSTPARYIINPSRPDERRLMAQVIAFHEGIPGHHLYASYPREKPPTAYDSGLSGLTEGWAIYSEYVADELGLYSTSLDVQGMIAKHLWAASRLVVEPGLHAFGWSREEAVSFMLRNTVLSRTEIEIEVDRYLAMPGQSLSYMFGADLLMSERERAQAVLGDAFDIKAFHDVVLIPGSRPLPVVSDDIRAWVDETLAASQTGRYEGLLPHNFGS